MALFKKGQSGNPKGRPKKVVVTAEPIGLDVDKSLEENIDTLFKAINRSEIDNRTIELSMRLLRLLYCKKRYREGKNAI